MIISADELELMEKHGLSISREYGHLVFFDEETRENYTPAAALLVAKAREEMSASKSNGRILVGIRSGTMAAIHATKLFGQSAFGRTEKDPKGTNFALLVYNLTTEEFDNYMETYMEESGRKNE